MPGTATISSGYTSRLQSNAAQCDQQRLLARLQGTGPYCPPTKSNTWAPAASVNELKASTRCAVDPKVVLTFPKQAMLSSAYTLAVQNDAIQAECSRFSSYKRFFPDKCACPAPTITNTGVPKPSEPPCNNYFKLF